MATKKDTVYEFDTLEFVNELVHDYTNLMQRAIKANDKENTDKFYGSITALVVLRDKLMREEAKEE